MKIGVKVLPRPEVLDSQGRAVAQTLNEHGRPVSQCRVGKYIELELDASDKEAALKQARELAEFVLYNPLIETFELEVVG
ncbi:MAG: phosphoribosylformylglycinamidine synthase subunit PurS [Bdellovibrionales bacterium]